MAQIAVAKAESKHQPGFFTSRWMVPFGEGMFGVNPFAMMQEFTKELEGAFGARSPQNGAAWFPAIECQRQNGTFLVTAELPGLTKDNVKVEVTGDSLVIEGERKLETKKEEEGYFRTERSYGKFYRSIPLPDGAKAEEVKAELTNGVLEVKIPVAETAPKMRKIPIQEGKK